MGKIISIQIITQPMFSHSSSGKRAKVRERRLSRLLNTVDLFPVQTSSCTFPCQGREKRERGGVVVSQYSTPTRDALTLTLLLKSKGLSVGSSSRARSRFALALFQVWEVKCKQFTDLLRLRSSLGGM